MRHTHLVLFGSCAVIAGACSNPTPPPAPSAFDRPESVTFFCWDRDRDLAVPLEDCAPEEGSEAGAPPAPLELHGAVTQTTTGEVAAVQITGDDDHPPGPIDTDVRVPGFTFAAVGEVPSGVVTPRSDPAFTYVISRGSATLHVVETASFRRGLGARVTLVEAPGGGPFFGAGARPTSVALTPGEDALVVTVTEQLDAATGERLAGEVWIVPIDRDTIGEPVRIALAADVPAAVDLTAVPEDQRPPAYELVCGVSPVRPEPAPPREPVTAGALPAPWAIAIDAERGLAIVSDTVLPVLHVIDLETQAEAETVNVGVPTRDIALTPRVPATLRGTTPTERFLYAIDDLDGSVLAVDLTDPARGSYGAVLTVSAAGAPDRLRVPFRAIALDVASLGYDEDAIELCDDASDLSPRALRGVFLTVATMDGRVRVYDVFDLDATCRGPRTCRGEGPEGDSDDQIVAIGRHRPRLDAFVRADEGVRVSEGPTWTVGATTATVTPEGSGGATVPTLETVECPDGLAPVFPSGGEGARVCAVTDPWSATSERYTFTWEGAIPFTTTSGGNFVEGEDVIEVRFDPCARGVLGASDVPASGELAGYAGDVVAITGELPPSLGEEERAACEELVELTAAGESAPVLLPILSAATRPEGARETYPGRLRVGDPIGGGFDLAAVRRCFPELLRLEVRVSGAFLATSTRAGFRSAVVRGDDGTCGVDPAALAAGQRGRAFLGEPFVTPDLAIHLEGEAPVGEPPVLQLVVGDVPGQLSFDIGFDAGNMTDLTSLLAEVVFNDVDERLYVVDQARRGLVRLDLSDPSSPFEAIFR